jgi:ATP-dependent NAD(P)H-hydrate dehydratase
LLLLFPGLSLLFSVLVFRCLITPNKPEFDRLSESLLNHLRSSSSDSNDSKLIQDLITELSSDNEFIRTRALSLGFGGITVYRKGENDIITSGSDVYSVKEKGSPRRCGGQGDILSGCLGTSFYWASKVSFSCFPCFPDRSLLSYQQKI